MVESVVFIPDVHLRASAPLSRAWKVTKKFIRDTKPNTVIVGGDFLEMEALSAWDADKRKLLEGKRYADEIKLGNRELDDIGYDCKIIFMEGNHEARVRAYVEKRPEMEGQVDIRSDLHLDDRGIEWVKENDLLKIGHMHFLHGWYWNKHHAIRHVIDIGGNCMYGHVHKPQVYCHELRSLRRTHMAMSVGCLCDLNPAWLRNKPNSWQHGFGYVEFRKDGSFQATPINIIAGSLTFAGQTWSVR